MYLVELSGNMILLLFHGSKPICTCFNLLESAPWWLICCTMYTPLHFKIFCLVGLRVRNYNASLKLSKT